MDTQKNLILSGDLKKVMWQMSWPAILAMVLFGLNNFMDAVFVGRLMNETALAAVGIAFPLAQIMVGLGSLIGTGAGSALSIWIGANKKDKLYGLLGNVNGLCLIFSIIISIPMYIYAEDIIHLMGAKHSEVAQLATEYFRVTVIGTVFWIHCLAINMLIRAEGKMKTAAVLMGLALLIDVCLKPIFISTFNWGVVGAAWATNMGMIAGSVFCLIYFARKMSTFETNWKSFKIDNDTFKIIMSLGIPGLIISVMMVLQNMAVYNAFGNFGTEQDIAFYATTIRIATFMITPLFGLMRALQPVAGMNYGAKQYERTKQSLKLFSFTGLILISPFFILFMVFPEFVLHLIMPKSIFSIEQINDFRIYMVTLPLLPLILLSISFLPAINRGKIASVYAVIRQIIFYIPVMIIIPRFFGVRSVYWGSTLIEICMFVFMLIIIRRVFNNIESDKYEVN